MKRILSFAILLTCAVMSYAYATSTTATFGDKNTSNVYRMIADSTGTVTFAQDTAILYPYTTASTNQTLTALNSGQVVVFNNGGGVSANGTQYTLPAATVGLDITIVADVAKWFYLAPAGTDLINITSNVASGRVSNQSSAAIGDSIEVFCATAGTWTVRTLKGTWGINK